MYWFALLFPPIMILLPGVFLAAVPPLSGLEAEGAGVRRQTYWLWLATAAALGVSLTIGLLFAPHPLSAQTWLLSAPLFAWVAVLLPRKNRDWGTQPGHSTVRTASLVNRSRERVVSPAWWSMGWLICAAGTAAVVVRWQLEPVLPMGLSAGAIVCLIAASLGVALGMACVRRAVVEPEPLDAAGSPQLAAEYAAGRQFKARVFAGMFGLAMPILMTLIAVGMAWLPPDASGMWIGLGGGIAGSVLGIAGGVLGTVASIRRARAAGMLRELESGAKSGA